MYIYTPKSSVRRDLVVYANWRSSACGRRLEGDVVRENYEDVRFTTRRDDYILYNISSGDDCGNARPSKILPPVRLKTVRGHSHTSVYEERGKKIIMKLVSEYNRPQRGAETSGYWAHTRCVLYRTLNKMQLNSWWKTDHIFFLQSLWNTLYDSLRHLKLKTVLSLISYINSFLIFS